ncbi:collagen alpha-2(I) chain-like [Antechinus flavipes]|uniref:collagen alpha-2(I) chain-like n=1 Tax=Antechinus flavipes TaxID=38775 RepID=UPI002236B915|nr:collagen alpha-2(I) chain-like [Antechinus flavipes]
MGGGASSPWIQQPVTVRPDAEELLRHNMQVPQRRADGRPGPQPPPGARPRMPQFQAESIRIPFAGHGRGRAMPPPVLHPRVVPAIPDLLVTALAAGGEGIPGARPGALGYGHWPQAYLENQHAALFGAGDGRMRVSVPGRRSPFFPDPHRGRQAVPHVRRHRRSRALPELLLATLARTEGEFSGAGSQALAQGPQASQAAPDPTGGDRAGPAPWPPRPQDPADGLPQPAGRAEDALGAQSPSGTM